MRYPDYRLCKRTANEILLRQDKPDINPNVFHLRSDKKIIVESIQEYCRLLHINRGKFFCDGKLLKGVKIHDKEKDIYTVLYNASVRRCGDIRWDVCHELGHLHLNHEYETDTEECEANAFARQILMPEYSVWKIWTEYKIKNIEAIASIFGVSDTIAQYRIDNLKKRGHIEVLQSDVDIWEAHKQSAEDRIEYIMQFYDAS